VSTYSSVDAVDQVNSVDQNALGQLHDAAIKAEQNWVKAIDSNNPCKTYSCYYLIIEMINKVGLDKTDGSVMAESQLMNVESEIEKCVANIGKFISELQSKEAGYNAFGSNGVLFPDTFLGLQSSYYNVSASGVENPSDDFTKSLKSFVSSIGKLFFSNQDTSAPLVSQLSKIENPNVMQNGQDFDLTNFWTNLSSQYKAYSIGDAQLFSANGNDHMSLMQQYVYYKAQAAVYNGSTSSVNEAQGDISKLVTFDLSGAGSDPFVSQMLGLYTDFNTNVSVATTAQGLPIYSTTSPNILALALADQRNNFGNQVGLYGAFSYEAYNSYWSQPNAVDGISQAPANAGPVVSGSGTSQGDSLTAIYSGINTDQASIGQTSSTDSTNMQGSIANEGSIVNVGQNSIQSLNQAVAQLCQNQLTG